MESPATVRGVADAADLHDDIDQYVMLVRQSLLFVMAGRKPNPSVVGCQQKSDFDEVRVTVFFVASFC